jgi:hypothetical protein
MGNGSGFPTSRQFMGTYDANPSAAQTGGQSTYEGSIAYTLLERAIVQQVLPGVFTLANRTDTATTHPVIHLIGRQRHPMFLENGVTVPAPDAGYREMILMVPFVVLGTGTKWHNFVVRMYLDDLGALEIGNEYYAYQKVFAALPEVYAPNIVDWAVLPLLQGDVFNSTVDRTGPWLSPSIAAVPGLTDVAALFSMPFVGTDVDVNGTVTRMVCSYWEWDYTYAEVAQATSDHEFLQQFCQGMNGWIGQPGGPPGEAIRIRNLRWRLAYPPPTCRF